MECSSVPHGNVVVLTSSGRLTRMHLDALELQAYESPTGLNHVVWDFTNVSGASVGLDDMLRVLHPVTLRAGASGKIALVCTSDDVAPFVTMCLQIARRYLKVRPERIRMAGSLTEALDWVGVTSLDATLKGA